ncbi:MAG TPA: type II toxin-antitoxin system RelE/ParE family toxin [Desulfobacter sp.]|nr:type II toxin-antitoxin system RelE/ParE family toxin [Desulfobacter sp.]
MIKSFKDKETQKVFDRIYSKKWSNELQRADRQGQYSIRINKQWRICFTWRQENAYDVEITDYH